MPHRRSQPSWPRSRTHGRRPPRSTPGTTGPPRSRPHCTTSGPARPWGLGRPTGPVGDLRPDRSRRHPSRATRCVSRSPQPAELPGNGARPAAYRAAGRPAAMRNHPAGPRGGAPQGAPTLRAERWRSRCRASPRSASFTPIVGRSARRWQGRRSHHIAPQGSQRRLGLETRGRRRTSYATARSAAPKAELNRSHQITTVSKRARSAWDGRS